MNEINDLDPEFIDFIFGGLDHGIYSIKDTGGPLIPFLMTKTGDVEDLKRFMAKTLEESIKKAEEALHAMHPKPDYALIAFDGYLTREGTKFDAIYVKAFDKTVNEGFEFCQCYVPAENGEGIEPVGNAGFTGKTINMLMADTSHSPHPETKKKPWWKF